MNDSILDSIKKMLGLQPEDDSFDQEIIIHINSAFMILQQLGVGTDYIFFIEDRTSEWSDFISNIEELALIKTYVYLKVKVIFDPPTSGIVSEAYKLQIAEFESRLNYQTD